MLITGKDVIVSAAKFKKALWFSKINTLIEIYKFKGEIDTPLWNYCLVYCRNTYNKFIWIKKHGN